jgi:hypothetical protein
MPHKKVMAFKGGTSLSKVYRAIDRFSEDIDVTVDYRDLDTSIDPFGPATSKNAIKKYSDKLKSFLREYSQDIVAPYFAEQLLAEFDDPRHEIKLSDCGEKLWVRYPKVMHDHDYMNDAVLIEFGGRNIAEPNEVHDIEPDISSFLLELSFPKSRVNVLPAQRTFWEKATLMHDECHRDEVRTNANRLSRHWYDLHMLAKGEVGSLALQDRGLLAEVVRHKKTFFSYKTSNYDACLVSAFKLVPDAAGLAALRIDYQRMVSAQYITNPPEFDDIIESLRAVEKVLNP